MFNREFSKSPYEIHLYAIDEGTGHLQRIYNIASYLDQYFSNITIFIYDIYNNIYIKEYIKKNNFKKKFKYKYYSDYNLVLSQKKIYLIILDIRDHHPNNIIKIYKDQKYFVLCIDNHHKDKNKCFYYWYTLPHPRLTFSIKDLIYKNFWNPYYIKVLTSTKSIKENHILIYLGLTEHIYTNFLRQTPNLDTIFKTFDIKDFFKYKLYFIDKNQYFTFDKFYLLLQKSRIVITYPGLLLYESILLKKEVLCYDLKSPIHYKILKKIQKQFKNNYLNKIHLNYNEHILTFYHFNFSKMSKDFDFQNQEKLWTSYYNVKKWIESCIKNLKNRDIYERE